MRPFLRDEIGDTDVTAARIAELQGSLEAARVEGAERDLLAALGQIGDLARTLGRPREAAVHLGEAVALAEATGDHDGLAANLVRLGTALQYGGDHAAGQTVLRRALEIARASGARRYESFALQHLGKCLAEIDRHAEARACLVAALAIRQELGDADLVGSTSAALAELASRMT